MLAKPKIERTSCDSGLVHCSYIFAIIRQLTCITTNANIYKYIKISKWPPCDCSRAADGSLFPWTSKKYYIFECMCSRASVCLGVCMPCVHLALLIQHKTRMRHIVTSFVAPLAQPYFWTLSHKRHDLKKVIEHKMCVFIFPKTLVWNIYHSNKNSARYRHKRENVFM
jgi:hypothetical protein